MASVHYQLIFPVHIEYGRKVIDIVRQTLQDIELLDENAGLEELPFSINKQNAHALQNGHFLVLIFIEMEEDLGDSKQIIELITKRLLEDDEIIYLFKYYDSTLQDLVRRYSTELFDLEMQIREILSLIFIDRYPDNPYDLFKETDIPLQNLAKNRWQKNPSKKESDLRQKYENEFFHILFSDYSKCGNLRELNERELYPYIESATNFEDFRRRFITRGIHNEQNKDFLISLQDVTEPLEEMRNCIAHNRTPTDEMIGSYEKAKEIIGEKIKDLWTFWNTAKEISTPPKPVKVTKQKREPKKGKVIQVKSKNGKRKRK
jgi:hypothetical protein